MSRYVIGVDGGATRTRAVVLDASGRELARLEGPASIADPRAPERSADVIATLVRDTAERAGVPLPCSALWVGVAGAGRETVRSGVEMALARHDLAERMEVGTDVEAAFADAFATGPGILVVSGTGSIAWGRSEAGTIGRVGGWGSLLGDEGSGYAIGVEALKRVARDVDGRGEQTRLEEEILGTLGLAFLDDIVEWAQTASKADIAALVPVVAECARDGDAVAGEILVEAVEELEGHILTLLDNLGPWTSRPKVALTGGLLEPGGPLRRGTEAVLRQHRIELVARRLDPAMGAARTAAVLGA